MTRTRQKKAQKFLQAEDFLCVRKALVFLRGYLFCYSITSKIVHKFYLLIQSQDLLKAENETRVVHREDCLGEEWFR